MPGAHLHVHSAFSFLDGASYPQELIAEAARVGIETMALTDNHRVSGIVPFLTAAQEYGIKALVGAEVQVEDVGRLVLLVPGTAQYRALTELLTAAHLTSPRGDPRVSWQDLARFGPDLVALTGDRRGILARLWLAGERDRLAGALERLRDIFSPSGLFIELTANYLPGDRLLFQALGDLAETYGLPLVATAAVHYATKPGFGLFDLLTCIRTGQRIEAADPSRFLNAENYVKPWDAMRAALKDWPAALEGTLRLADRLDTPQILRQRRTPLFAVPEPGISSEEYLVRVTRQGAAWRYPDRMKIVWPRIAHELAIIQEMGFADYFLVVWDIARFARRHNIRFAGRGSAADSVVAYCLGITDVDAHARHLLFERFMSRERQETPDIDIDFDAGKRDTVVAYVRGLYGEEHVARVATYQTFRQRLAVREIGKVLGFPADELDALAKSLPHAPLAEIVERWDDIPELRQYPEAAKLKRMLTWAQAAEGLPRHIGTHVGGVVISREPLAQVSPREWSQKGVQIVPFDKRDVEALGLLKLDLLALRTFTAVDIAVGAIVRDDDSAFSYEHIPLSDSAVYERLGRGEGVGVFQLESPAQRALAQRLKPDRWEDIVASLALIRPGPIKGNMVDPFVARRQGKEPVTYLHPDLEPILSKTYGVVLFQEQVIAIASVLAGFTPGEADALRRVMTHARSSQEMHALGEQFKRKAIARGISPQVAEAVFGQIVGYASYGFNEAHAAAFAETAYRTAYLLEHHPVAYFLGLLNAQPMGYYPLDVIVVEARNRGIHIGPADINVSDAVVIREGNWGLRIGLGMIKGVGSEVARAIVLNRPPGGYRHPAELLEGRVADREQVKNLVRVGAFDRIYPDRDGLLEDIVGDNRLGLTGATGGGRVWDTVKQLAWDYRLLGFGQRRHWLEPWRPRLEQEGFRTSADVKNLPDGLTARLVGMLIRPHRPPTRSGRLVVFFSLLDEYGLLEARLSQEGYQQFGHLLFGRINPVLAVMGRKQGPGLDVKKIWPWPDAR